MTFAELNRLKVGEFIARPHPMMAAMLLVRITRIEHGVDEDGDALGPEDAGARTIRVLALGLSSERHRSYEFCFFAVLGGPDLEGYRLVDT